MPYLSKPAVKRVEHVEQRAGGALELDDLAGQLVDAPRHVGVAAEDLGLDLVDVVLQAGDHRRVPVDDPSRIAYSTASGPRRSRSGSLLQPAAHRGQVGRLAVPDGDDEVGPDEDVELAELDLLDVVEVAGGPQDHEQGVAVALELGPLVGDDRVLDGAARAGRTPRPRTASSCLVRPVRGRSRPSATVERQCTARNVSGQRRRVTRPGCRRR